MLVTAHRRESFGRPFADLCQALRAIADAWPNLRVVYPVHPNPNVRGPAAALLGDHPRIHLIDPVGYQSFVLLMRSAWLVLTDSGGIQEEAPGLGKPVLVLRETTERPEAIAAGTARLVGTSPERIQAAVAALVTDPVLYANMATARNPFGDGRAAARIVARLAADVTDRRRLNADQDSARARKRRPIVRLSICASAKRCADAAHASRCEGGLAASVRIAWRVDSSSVASSPHAP